ncbi:MAG: hypothetical protein U0414_31120 [Polyangiaceae bacterium]
MSLSSGHAAPPRFYQNIRGASSFPAHSSSLSYGRRAPRVWLHP